MASDLLSSLAQQPLVLVIDGTAVGRGRVALYVGVVYRRRLLPIVWTIVAQKKRHLPESVHVELMTKVRALVPEWASLMESISMRLSATGNGPMFVGRRRVPHFTGKVNRSMPERVAHLLIPACLVYYWVIFLGVEAIRTGLDRIIHGKSRTDLSLFQLGLSLLDYLLDKGLRIPLGFSVPPAVQEGVRW